jgi:hypothetical protein
MAGASVSVPDDIKRSMFFTPILWHYLTLTENEQSIFAMAAYLQTETRATLLGKIYPGLLDTEEALTSIGAIPLNVEQVLLTRPDAVLC